MDSLEGVNRDNERLYIEDTSTCGDSDRVQRKDSGNELLEDVCKEYVVDSKVMRRISHFRRSSDKTSSSLFGGFRIENADRRRLCVVSRSRRTKALAARVYNERKVALVDVCGADEESCAGTNEDNGANFTSDFRVSTVDVDDGVPSSCFTTVVVTVGIEADGPIKPISHEEALLLIPSRRNLHLKAEFQFSNSIF